MAGRTQADTEFLAREIAAVRLALADVVTTQDLEDSLAGLAKLIADQQPQRAPELHTTPDGRPGTRAARPRRTTEASGPRSRPPTITTSWSRSRPR